MCSMNLNTLVQMQEMEHLRTVEKPWVVCAKAMWNMRVRTIQLPAEHRVLVNVTYASSNIGIIALTPSLEMILIQMDYFSAANKKAW